MQGVKINDLNIIKHTDGDIYHCLKNDDNGFSEFGEIYFTCINYKKIKAWKKHTLMTMNLVVPYGEVKFVFHKNEEFFEITLSQKNYKRLTVSPNIWFGFKGLGESFSLVANIANIKHDPLESEKLGLKEIKYIW